MNITEADLLSVDLNEIKSTSGNNAKSELAKKWDTGYHHEFLDLVGNDKRQWFVTWETVSKTKIPSGADLTLDEVLYAAENRIATPNETASRLASKIEDGWPENVLRAIINKTLDAGITVAGVKKAQGKRVRKFNPSLCADWLKMSDKVRTKTLTQGRYVSTPKMDGLRCLFVLNCPGEGAFSRSMKPLKNLSKHLAALKTVFTEPCTIDGEVLSDTNDWADSMSGAKRTGAKVNMLFYAFDYVPGQEHATNDYQTPSEARYERLIEGMDQLSPDLFRIVIRSQIMRTADDVQGEHDACVDEGWEGAVLHNLDAPYACKRTRAWIKVKQFVTYEFMCDGFFLGTGKHSERLGGIVVSGLTPEGILIQSEVGTGFSDKEREDIWKNQSVYLGRSVEIKYFEVTPDSSLRFPSFLRWRDAE